MKRLLALLVCLPLVAATVTLSWDPNDPAEEVTGYYLYASTNVAGPYAVLSAAGTNLSCTVTTPPARLFFYLTASNMWGESLPSDTVHIAKPVGGVTNLRIRLTK